MNASLMAASQFFAKAHIGTGQEKQTYSKRKINYVKHRQLLLSPEQDGRSRISFRYGIGGRKIRMSLKSRPPVASLRSNIQLEMHSHLPLLE
jgi:hypothetical protein